MECIDDQERPWSDFQGTSLRPEQTFVFYNIWTEGEELVPVNSL